MPDTWNALTEKQLGNSYPGLQVSETLGLGKVNLFYRLIPSEICQGQKKKKKQQITVFKPRVYQNMEAKILRSLFVLSFVKKKI
jgi:hypothetical protein